MATYKRYKICPFHFLVLLCAIVFSANLADSQQQAMDVNKKVMSFEVTDVRLAKVLSSVKEYFGKAVSCEEPSDNYIGNKKITVNVKNASFSKVIAEISLCSGYGFTNFFDGALFSASYPPLIDYIPIKSEALALLGERNQAKKHHSRLVKNNLILRFLRDSRCFGSSKILDASIILPNKKVLKIEPVISGRSFGSKIYRDWGTSLPPEAYNKKVTITGKLDAIYYLNTKEINLTAKLSSRKLIHKTVVGINEVTEKQDSWVIGYSISLPSKLGKDKSKEIKNRMQNIYNDRRSGNNISLKDADWFIKIRSELNIDDFRDLAVIGIKGKFPEGNIVKSIDSFSMAFPGVGVLGYATFKKESYKDPPNLMIKYADKNSIVVPFKFKDIFVAPAQ